ncbi:alanine racemase, putative [Trypanosoma equiperdum]|uniref:Pyridoxal phosphate homeostasis protein n=4 Tax=Trypanozoon TaxID=39700 RepID=Q57VD5_TRYB2|nr:hypothetical protein, conserved [Trypanosoma brucei gambiense DAL972]XP_844802.1 hypothetical protein, conserved [Trypanosoma brucei brucei TREU927]AAX70461.1 hypothetical protein, conserved [Trypanosoma brucei]RHW72521.1 alanine racemase [Trypanosoma brucei equiperdum]SCU68183.1 alanine racemase, putative [Trypanosoma equiperdum]AAZ11243.1 hypothetical protein, conserved [Trypanosoma brucei brucei TREU927]CBH11039.1 hypothetical protein, conserved [Trypanosoma brucei gambiense DAL972]|eukprot:XP_011773326.1 hypothetical protein, conserved [Trypanosoma brucei gambiense DAL972]
MSRYDIGSEPPAEVIAENYREVQKCIREAAAEGAGGGSADRAVKLVAVSKTKSPACLQALYDCGHRDFGENYVQEVVEKAAVLPGDIHWHFIGHLQSNKVKELLSGVSGLQIVQTVDSESLAQKLDSGCVSYRGGRPLDVYVQVNTSGETTKSGVEPGSATVELARHISTKCPNLRLTGLMTIGMPDYTSRPENFECLLRCREEVAAALNLDATTLALSMGMSGDYTNAIRMGSTVVRVGTGLFGQRYYPPKDGAAK